jgi:hypothetical protein
VTDGEPLLELEKLPLGEGSADADAKPLTEAEREASADREPLPLLEASAEERAEPLPLPLGCGEAEKDALGEALPEACDALAPADALEEPVAVCDADASAEAEADREACEADASADAEALSLRAPEASALGLSHERVPRALALTLGDALGERDGAPEADTEQEGAAEREPLTV